MARLAITASIGVLLLVVGVGMTIWRSPQPVEFEYSAYAPLSHETFVPHVVDPLVTVGYICSVVGAAVTGVAAGALIRVRRRR